MTNLYEGFGDDLMKEIADKTLARTGLNLFKYVNLDTYAGYEASVVSTNVVFREDDRHKKDTRGKHGFAFENLSVGKDNIRSAIRRTGEKTYTTDTTADIRKAWDNKDKLEKLHGLQDELSKFSDRKNKDLSVQELATKKLLEHQIGEANAENKITEDEFEFIDTNFTDEVSNSKNRDAINKYSNDGKRNNEITDTIKVDKYGNVIRVSQLKNIENVRSKIVAEYKANKKEWDYKDRYLENDEILVPKGEAKKIKAELKRLAETDGDQKVRELAQKMLDRDMIKEDDTITRDMTENPKKTAVGMQSAVAAMHVAQAGLSDAIATCMATLIGGVMWEVKDMASGNDSVSVMDRIKRLIQKVIDDFKSKFARGAGFGAIDAIVGVVGQIFTSIAKQLKMIWKSLRSAAKSIYNAIIDFMSGKIKTFRTFIRHVIKGIVSAAMVINTLALENIIKGYLSPLGVFAEPIAIVLAITAGAFATVTISRSIDATFDIFFLSIDQAKVAKENYERISKLCDEMLPQLMEEKDRLAELVDKTHKERKIKLDSSFATFKDGLNSEDIDEAMKGLREINEVFGIKSQFDSYDEFCAFMIENDIKPDV